MGAWPYSCGSMKGAWPDLLQLPAAPPQRRQLPARHFLAPPPFLPPLLLLLVLLLSPPAGPTGTPPGFELHLGLQFPLQDVASEEGGQRQLRAGRRRELLEADSRHRPGRGGGVRVKGTPEGPPHTLTHTIHISPKQPLFKPHCAPQTAPLPSRNPFVPPQTPFPHTEPYSPPKSHLSPPRPHLSTPSPHLASPDPTFPPPKSHLSPPTPFIPSQAPLIPPRPHHPPPAIRYAPFPPSHPPSDPISPLTPLLPPPRCPPSLPPIPPPCPPLPAVMTSPFSAALRVREKKTTPPGRERAAHGDDAIRAGRKCRAKRGAEVGLKEPEVSSRREEVRA